MKKQRGIDRAEQIFFDDPAVDGVMGVLMALATDHYVLRDRVRILESELAKAGHVNPTALAAAPAPEEMQEAQDEAAAFVQELLRPLLGLQEAAGPSGRYSLKAHAVANTLNRSKRRHSNSRKRPAPMAASNRHAPKRRDR
jgi:hypothetical protein